MRNVFLFIIALSLFGCKKNIKQQEDEIYSRHLQEHVKLTIISTPVPDDKSTLNLLLLNDGQDANDLKIKDIADSLYKKKLIQPLLIVAIHAANRSEDYGVSGFPDYNNNGNKADKYSAFIDNELYPFIKKKTSVRKFNSVAIAGYSQGGLSAFDVAWDNADKIDKIGAFSGSFWWRDKNSTDPTYRDDKDRIIINKIRSSRKKPHLQYWFSAGTKEEESDRDKDGVIDVIDDTKDLIALINSKNVGAPGDIVYKEIVGGKHELPYFANALADFIVWAFPKN